MAGALALAGVGDTAYLMVLSGAAQAGEQCPAGGCGGVLGSAYAHTFGVSNSVWGLLAYALAMALVGVAVARVPGPRRAATALLMAVNCLGVAAHAYFVYLKAAVLREFCPFCLTSAGLMVFLAAAATVLGYQELTVAERDRG
ncbi:MAG: hypothetical protein FJ029_03975 [Actinobacteria bacterium]|nr:hypothetical protein [Actinomycetota bacterium]